MSEKLTGYPSVDKPWLKYYKENSEEFALNFPTDKTVWDVIEKKMIEYKDVPAIEYFGRVISRPEFIDMVYTWAKAFKAMGVKENEIVAYYGPFFPDIGAMTFALNMIGACPYFLKLAISPEALAEETAEVKIAIVFEDMWQNVSCEFSKDRFEKVIIINAADGMSGSKKQIVSLLTKLKSKNAKEFKEVKYLSIKQAKSLAKAYTGEVKAPFVSNRSTFITSSSGTTVGGVVKGCVATNESTISQFYMCEASKPHFYPGDKCLNNFPPTASTSLNVIFFQALYMGETILMDPRVTEDDFYEQIIKLKPNLVVSTGSMWESFFNRIENEMNKGVKFNFDYAKSWYIGGEGTDTKKFIKWCQIMKRANSQYRILSGYGASELFSVTSWETAVAKSDVSKRIMNVGIPEVGSINGIFNADGKELRYNQRGELWIKSPSAMKEYYNKPKLTSQRKINGWIHTGDLAEIDENGFVYIWGRVKDTVTDKQGNQIYLFDIAYKIKEKSFVDDAIVLPMATIDDTVSLVAHIVWDGNPSLEDQKHFIEELNACMKEYLLESFSMVAYSIHDIMLPYSPTTLKKDKNKLSKQTDGYIQVIDGQIRNVKFIPSDNQKLKLFVED